MSTGSGELKLRIGAGSRSGGPATTALARLDDDFAGLGGGMRGTRAGAAPAVVAALDGTLTVGLDEVLAIEWGEVVEFVRAEDLERDERFETTVVDGVLTVTPRRSAPPSTRSTRAGLAIRRTWLAPIVQRGVGELAKELEEKQLSGDERVLIVERDGTLTPCEGPKDRHWGKAGDVLVLIHGTASSTRGSFGELLSSPAWPTVWDRFGGRVAALQHRTLTRDPFQNALTLMEALPARAVSLQVLTHSRGGLVADALLWATDVGANGAGGVEDVSNTAMALAREADRRPSGGAVTVDSMVRVACPARGTPILSERLDRFLTLLFNVGRLAANAAAGPLAGAVVKAFGQVVVAAAKARERLDVLPGLAAMIPGSDVVSLLNGPPRSGQLSPSKLVVVAGDLEPSGMKMVALDLVASGALFRGREHDLVVPVASMSGGILRTERSRFLRRGARVHHLTYFENDDSRAFIAATLRGERPTGALPLVAGAGEGAERSAWGKLPWTELAALEPGAVGGPLVFIIPGIAGSGLRDDSRPGKPRVVWGDLNTVGVVLNPSVLSPSKDLTPIADCQVTRYFYGDASTKLSSKAKVVLFAYDWRRSVVDAGGILADVIRSRPTTGEKIFLVAHSMGGLVARAAIHALGAEWDERVAAGARLVQLGTPNEGSWLAPQLVSGDAEIVDGPLGVALS
ncbi:MAG: hypothetical protein H6698_07280, partial [Myxococcales bacterium]|nr:hypothetical protein [Myxococcales bacterium]